MGMAHLWLTQTVGCLFINGGDGPAKGVVSVMVARVQIPASPLIESRKRTKLTLAGFFYPDFICRSLSVSVDVSRCLWLTLWLSFLSGQNR